jgi:hypothetical protein
MDRNEWMQVIQKQTNQIPFFNSARLPIISNKQSFDRQSFSQGRIQL